MDAKRIGNRINRLRRSKRISLEELAEHIGFSPKTIEKWENGVELPDFAVSDKLVSELDTSITELLGFENVSEEEMLEEVFDLTEEEKLSKSDILNLVIVGILFVVFVVGLFLKWNYLESHTHFVPILVAIFVLITTLISVFFNIRKGIHPDLHNILTIVFVVIFMAIGIDFSLSLG